MNTSTPGLGAISSGTEATVLLPDTVQAPPKVQERQNMINYAPLSDLAILRAGEPNCIIVGVKLIKCNSIRRLPDCYCGAFSGSHGFWLETAPREPLLLMFEKRAQCDDRCFHELNSPKLRSISLGRSSTHPLQRTSGGCKCITTLFHLRSLGAQRPQTTHIATKPSQRTPPRSQSWQRLDLDLCGACENNPAKART